LADDIHPKSTPCPVAELSDQRTVDGFAVTPVEGVDLNDIPKLPMQPEEVLELLMARLALDDNGQASRLVGAVAHEVTNSSVSSWPPQSDPPSYPDMTPSPVVIGGDEIAALLPQTNQVRSVESPQDWREPASNDTPAEPIASLRVRQASRSDVIAQEASTDADNDSNTKPSTSRGPMSARQYFPPMRPPELAPYNSSGEPLVHVVPDCDAKMRTAKGLRRPFGRPARSVERRWSQSVVVLTVGGLMVAVVTAVVTRSATRTNSSDATANSVSATSQSTLLAADTSSAQPASQPSTADQDSGVLSRTTDGRPATSSAKLSASGGGNASSERSNPKKDLPTREGPREAKPTKAAGSRDGLVF
jgi:hypothetical protein